MRPATHPNDPLLRYATTAVDVVPGQSVGYPLCPYHDAWKPCSPRGTLAGGGMPGPTLLAHPPTGGVGDGGVGTGVAVGVGVGKGVPWPSVVSRPAFTVADPSVPPAASSR
jgi:hypothetical protein